MSWHYSQALAAAFSAGSSADSEPCAPSKSTNTLATCCSPGKTTEASNPSPCGTISAPSMGSHGADWWMSSLAASRAKTSAPPEGAQGSTAHAPASGAKWRGSLARWDRDTCSWRTPQTSLLADLDVFSETWPRWGMMQDGECSALSMPEHLTSGNESGLWPTPLAHAGSNRRQKPTPAQAAGKAGMQLSVAVRLWPTPTAVTNTGGAALCKWGGSGARAKLRTMVSDAELNGALNPTWVEWLMGWPLGWTDLRPLETAKCREWWHWHGSF